jgi:hypothetical protein
MPDTVAIAAIAGGSAVLGGVIGAGASHWTTIRSHKLQGQKERREERQQAYLDLLASVHEFMQAAGGVERKKLGDWQWCVLFLVVPKPGATSGRSHPQTDRPRAGHHPSRWRVGGNSHKCLS